LSSGRREELAWSGPGDFVRLDPLCAGLLQDFFGWLQTRGGGNIAAERAGALAHAADRYLRDFVVDITEAGPADAEPSLPRRYLANWYIVNTLSPTHAEVDTIREALFLLHRYREEKAIIDAASAAAAQDALADAEYFHRRLEEFWDLTPDTIAAWRGIDEVRRARPAVEEG
jgi:hypothetical protein